MTTRTATVCLSCAFLCGVLALTAATADPGPFATQDDVRTVTDPASGRSITIKQRDIDAVNMDAFVGDTQWMVPDADRLLMVWWMPKEFWEVSIALNPVFDFEEARAMLVPLDKYEVVAVVDGTIGTFGDVDFYSEERVRSSTTLKLADGSSLAPVAMSAVDRDVQDILREFRPMLSQLIGPMGENMHFMVFDKTGQPDSTIVDTMNIGTLRVISNGKEAVFTTPLPSLLKDKSCPSCKRTFRGDYTFCPYDSSDLSFVD